MRFIDFNGDWGIYFFGFCLCDYVIGFMILVIVDNCEFVFSVRFVCSFLRIDDGIIGIIF